MARLPEAWKKPSTSIAKSPEAASVAPAAPSMSKVTARPGPVATSSGEAAKSTTWPSASARLMRTSTEEAVAVMPLTPVSEALPALACSALHWRATEGLAAGSCSRISASAKPTSFSSRPVAWAVPPSTPAKASTPSAPSVRASTCTSWPSTFTVSVALVSAKLPATWKNPKASTSSVPRASSSSPRWPSMSSVMLVPGPVGTTSDCAA